MTTLTFQPTWLLRWLAPRAPAPHAATEPDYASLADLSPRTLRDIGAPEHLQQRDDGLPLWRLDRGRW